MARTPPPLRLEMFIVASCLLCYLEMSGGKSEIMAFMSRGAPPRQNEKANHVFWILVLMCWILRGMVHGV